MIYTRWGNKVRVIGGNEERGIVHIKYMDQTTRCVDFIDLKADGGVEEVIREIRKSNEEE